MDNPNPMDIHLWTTLTLTLWTFTNGQPDPNTMDIQLWTTLTLTLWTFTYGQP